MPAALTTQNKALLPSIHQRKPRVVSNPVSYGVQNRLHPKGRLLLQCWDPVIARLVEEIIRIISARKARARERKIYAQGIDQPT